ncbi:MAG TPA: HEAT repeat domain-containing protein [Tepidisphaeraceae bacterium]|jgi:HEAT repeat protein|nr:HEAT repeat domain-containing protein [Tepidisphaeraceae bacterium]
MHFRFLPLILATALLCSCAHGPPAADRTSQRHPTPAEQDRVMAENLGKAVAADLAEIIESKTSTAKDKCAACYALEVMGRYSASATGALADALAADDPLQTYATRALIAIGPAAVPILRQRMNDPKAVIPYTIAQTLAQIEVNANISPMTFAHRLNNGLGVERIEAAWALTYLRTRDSQRLNMPGGAPAPVMADPIAVLTSKSSTVADKVDACQALHAMGQSASGATGALIAALGESGLVRFNASRALVAIGEPAMPALRRAAREGPADLRQIAIEILAQIDVNIGVPEGVLKDRLAGADPIDRDVARIALAGSQIQFIRSSFYHDASELHRLVNVAISDVPARQVIALQAISDLQSDASDIAPLIRPLLESKSPEVATAAAHALASMGARAMPLLLDGLKSPVAQARMLAATELGLFPAMPGSLDSKAEFIAALTPLLDDSSPKVVLAAARTLSGYGLDAHPALVKAMKAGKHYVKAEVVEQLLTQPEGFTEHQGRRGSAVPPNVEKTERELARLVAPALLERAKAGNNATQWAAMTALRCLPPEVVVDQLVGVVQLSTTDPQAAFNAKVAGTILAELGPAGIPKLVEVCSGHNIPMRATAMQALLLIPSAKDDPKVVAIMTAALNDPSDVVRAQAFKWALTVPNPPPQMQKFMIDAMSDQSDTIRSDAFWWALGLQNPPAKVVQHVADVLLAYVSFTKGGTLVNEEKDRVAAITMLGHFPLETDTGVKALMLCLNDSSQQVRLSAITALRSYNERAKIALPVLGKLASSDDEVQSTAAAATMLDCGREGRKAVAPYYIHRLQLNLDVGGDLRAIALIGPDATGAVPLLNPWLSSQDNALRVKVADALGEIGPGAAEAVPGLVRMMDNANVDIRQSASQALVKISPDGKGLSPALLAAIYNSDRAAADRLAAALRNTTDQKKLLARVGDLAANDPDAAVRATAHLAVGVLSSDASPAAATQPAKPSVP